MPDSSFDTFDEEVNEEAETSGDVDAFASLSVGPRDWTVDTILDQIRKDNIDLDPSFQRRNAWNDQKRSRFIESLILGVPIPQIVLAEQPGERSKFLVIDGKQRLSAITSFLSNNLVLSGLKIFADINGSKFNDLPIKLRSIIRTRPTLRAIIILRQSDSDLKYEVFHRLNTGGEHLNPQEIRNNAFHGSLNTLIMELAESKIFHSALGITNKYRSAIYQEMRDAEFVLRFFTFKDDWEIFTGGVKRRMDHFMEANRNPDTEALNSFRTSFFKTLDVVTSVFGEHAFHRWMPERQSWRHHVLAALYDAQMFACQHYDPEQLVPYRDEIVAAFKLLFSDEAFRRSIDAATNTPSYFKDRSRRLRDLLTGITRFA